MVPGKQLLLPPTLPLPPAGYDFVEDDYVADDCDGHGGRAQANTPAASAGYRSVCAVAARMPSRQTRMHCAPRPLHRASQPTHTVFPATPRAAGTHVAGTAVGLQVGVAKEAQVVAVRILDCTGSGTISNTVAGLDWVAGEPAERWGP